MTMKTIFSPLYATSRLPKSSLQYTHVQFSGQPLKASYRDNADIQEYYDCIKAGNYPILSLKEERELTSTIANGFNLLSKLLVQGIQKQYSMDKDDDIEVSAQKLSTKMDQYFFQFYEERKEAASKAKSYLSQLQNAFPLNQKDSAQLNHLIECLTPDQDGIIKRFSKKEEEQATKLTANLLSQNNSTFSQLILDTQKAFENFFAYNAFSRTKAVGEINEDVTHLVAQLDKTRLVDNKNKKPLALRMEKGIFDLVNHLVQSTKKQTREPLLYLFEKENRGRVIKTAQTIVKAKNKLVTHNLRLALPKVKKYRGQNLDLPDLIGEANCGLMRSTEVFDYQMGLKFSTFATWWTMQPLNRTATAQKNQIHNKSITTKDVTQLSSAKHQFRGIYGHHPEPPELAIYLYTNEEYRRDPSTKELDQAMSIVSAFNASTTFHKAYRSTQTALSQEAKISQLLQAESEFKAEHKRPPTDTELIKILNFKTNTRSLHNLRLAVVEKEVLNEKFASIRQKEQEFLTQYGKKPNNHEFAFYLVHGKAPQEEELQKMEEFLKKLKQVETITRSVKVTHQFSETEGANGVEKTRKSIDLLPDPRSEGRNSQTKPEELQENILNNLFKTLNDREEEVLRLRYTPPALTLMEVGKHFGLTKERIRQIEARAIKKLQKYCLKNPHLTQVAMAALGVETEN